MLTKRLLGLSYLWVGDRNGVEIQLYATWLFYAVLSELCVQVAVALSTAAGKDFGRDGISQSLSFFASD